jgi:hypothetical protein
MQRAAWMTLAPTLVGFLLFAIDRLRVLLGAGAGTRLRVAPTLTLLAGYIVLPLLLASAAGLARQAGQLLPAARRDTALGRLLVPSAILFAIALRPAMWVGEQLSSGEWISTQWFAPIVAAAPIGGALISIPLALFIAFSPPSENRRRRLVAIATGGALFAALLMADQRVAFGLYPEFHLTLHVAASVVALIAVRRLLAEIAGVRTDRWLRRAAPLALAACVVAPLAWFRMPGPTRGALAFGSPVARDWLQQTRRKADARMLRDTLATLDVRAGRYEPSGTSLPRGLINGREYNVLFIVVDALRADALPPARPKDGLPFSRVDDTPNLDRWIEGAYQFENVYSVATKTYLAMPAIFRSVEASDNNVTMGEPLALRMQSLGRNPVAVAIDYFFSPKHESVAALVEGFGDMVFYEKAHTEQAVPATIDMLRGVKDERFFLWLHMYNVHDPGFDGTLLSSADCSRVDCYRRSMRWLDDEFAKLMAALDELGLRENTIVVLTADHGEGLGDHGLILHGPNVFEEDVRVPLMIAVPGHTGTVIDEPVGTIDIAPTLVDLLGGPVEPQDRGRSLVPLMAGATDVPPRAYYFQNHTGKVMGVVAGRDKVIYDSNLDVVYRFDLEEDPDEFDDLFDPAGELDRELLRVLIGFNPAMVDDEFDDPETTELLASRLSEVDANEPGAALPLLLRLVAHSKDPALVTQAVELFQASRNRGVRLLILRNLYDAAPRRFGADVTKWLKRVADTPEELEIVEDLTAQGQAALPTKEIVARLTRYAKTGTPEQWLPYLRLTRPWTRTARTYREALIAMLNRSRTEQGISTTLIELVLESTASLEIDARNATALAAGVKPLLEHREAGVRAMAIRALAGLDQRAELPSIRAALTNLGEDPRVRREAAAALAKIEGAKAIDDLIAAATDASMEVIVVRQLNEIGSADGLPYLRNIAESHYNAYLRREAARAVERIEAGPRKKSKSKSKSKAKSKDEEAPPAVRTKAQVKGARNP